MRGVHVAQPGGPRRAGEEVEAAGGAQHLTGAVLTGQPLIELINRALGIALAIAVEIPKRPQTSLLHNIGGIGIVARQPACERIAGVEMRQHHRLEPALPTPLRDPRHVLFYPIPAKTAATAELFRGGGDSAHGILAARLQSQ